jgi:AmiR/NasT family two-component response regulator
MRRRQQAGIPYRGSLKGYREKTFEAGCSGYIEKPIDPETIIAQIK